MAYDIHVGLAWNEGSAATAAGWQGLLAARKIREPVPLPKPFYKEPHPLI
jgi:hypothetical protein